MKGLGLLIAGTEGVGKTTFAAEFPKPATCFSCNETGMEDLIELGYIDGKHVNNVIPDTFGELRVGIQRCESKTIIVDALKGLETMLFGAIISEKYNNNVDAFYDYYKGPRQVAPPIASDFCNMLENKRRSGHHVLVLSHVKHETVTNPNGVDYKTIDLDIDEGIRSIFKKWAANIILMMIDPGVKLITKENKAKQATEAKMNDDDARMIFTQQALTHCGKNKLRLPKYIPMGDSPEEAYDNFCRELPPLYKEQLIA